jgi:hypothetical protein
MESAMHLDDDIYPHDDGHEVELVEFKNDMEECKRYPDAVPRSATHPSSRLTFRPSVVLPLLLHRDDVLTKIFHLQYFLGAIVFVLVVIFAYLVHELPAFGDAKSKARMIPSEMNPWTDSHSFAPTTHPWHMLERMAFLAPNTSSSAANAFTTVQRVNTSIVCAELWSWWEQPTHNSSALWSHVWHAHEAWCRSWIPHAAVARALTEWTLMYIVWTEFLTLFQPFAVDTPSASSFDIEEAWMDLRENWNSEYARDWLYMVAMDADASSDDARRASREAFFTLYDPPNDTQKWAVRVDPHAVTSVTRAMPWRRFLRDFQRTLVSPAAMWLEHTDVMQAWSNQTHRSVDALLHLHIPYLDVFMRAQHPTGALPRIHC